MNTTVTVDNETRKRLKRLAAVLDETQGRIVRKAVAMFESQMKTEAKAANIPKGVAEKLERASAAIRKKDAKWAMVSRIMEQSSTSLDEFAPAAWGRET